MAIINKTFISDPPLAYVKTLLRKRQTTDRSDPQNPVPGPDQYYALCDVRFDGNRAITKEVLLSRLTASERAAGLAFYNAVHALAASDVTEDDL